MNSKHTYIACHIISQGAYELVVTHEVSFHHISSARAYARRHGLTDIIRETEDTVVIYSV